MGWSGMGTSRKSGWRSQVLRECLVAFAILALALRIVFPPGFMPVHTADGFTITICSGYGPATIQLDSDGTPLAPVKTAHHVSPCVFSGVGAALSAITPALVALAIAYIIVAGFRSLVPYLIAFRTGMTPPLRAPPATLHA